VKYINDPSQFLIDSGLLYEINRKVMHPLGMAIAVTLPDEIPTAIPTSLMGALAASAPVDEPHGLIQIWDNRDDLEGIYFVPEAVDAGEIKLAKTISAAKPRLETRRKALGYVIQGYGPDETAQRAYHAYGVSTGGVNFLGKPMPQWRELTPAIQQAWRDATAAVVEP
jgi:hypothetical protein